MKVVKFYDKQKRVHSIVVNPFSITVDFYKFISFTYKLNVNGRMELTPFNL